MNCLFAAETAGWTPEGVGAMLTLVSGVLLQHWLTYRRTTQPPLAAEDKRCRTELRTCRAEKKRLTAEVKQWKAEAASLAAKLDDCEKRRPSP